ncbi:MAG: hypothetical protein CK426_02285 [Legionella sp.]|nr:MAG: hypothetical protein CK423_00615 [Legionella sp.]PJD99630.1 MAG: hypothetical protein CK426_02285 [Legionella sp.]
MDENLRKKARTEMSRAALLESYNFSKHDIRNCYANAIEYSMQIENKMEEDYLRMSHACHTIAIINFNAKKYDLAAQYYHESAQHLQHTTLNDVRYRTLVKLYIDLSDACSELYHQDAANEAINNAIQAFHLIQNKTNSELHIGNPREHFKAFYELYEAQTSTNTYITSTKFTNHEQLLMERQQEALLLSQFSDISMEEMNDLNNHLENMLQYLPEKAKNPFSPVLFNQKPNDDTYRSAAKDFLRMAQSHMQTGSISDTIASYRQAIHVLDKVSVTTSNDTQIIAALNNQITYLQKKSTPARPNAILAMFANEETAMEEDEEENQSASYMSYSK